MNKIVLLVCLLLLVICSANLYVLVRIVTTIQEAGEKIHKEFEKVQPALKEVKDKLATMAPPKPPVGPGDLKGKPAGETSDSNNPEPKLPPVKPPVPPGPLPK